ncbi:MAG: phosphodiesterase [Deltaproteobacteria bacterium]|jgi:3',5'-cyclic AMP phosphodiesterase CpdA|nr:phosphodiesterase [Deltaproteobacteria bacterium]
MIVLQLADFHVRGDDRLSFRVVNTRHCLNETVAHLKTLEQEPDALVLTGDLADSGDEKAYRILHASLSALGWPTYAIPGNHDRRDRMRDLLPGWCPADSDVAPYICYTVENGPVRLVMIDTMNPGSHDGRCHAAVMTWLDETLAQRPHMPTLLFMHHPPFATGFPVMDVPVENVDALAAVIRKNPLTRLCCGHIHRPILGQWMGVPAVTAPAVSMQMEFDLGEKGGDEFRLETPGYLLHHWKHGVLNTHVCQIATRASFAGPYPFTDSVNPG